MGGGCAGCARQPHMGICDLGPGMEESECWALMAEFLGSSRGTGPAFLTPGRGTLGGRVPLRLRPETSLPHSGFPRRVASPWGSAPYSCEGGLWLSSWVVSSPVGARDGGPGALSSGKAPTLPTWWQVESRPCGSQREQSWEAPAECSGVPQSSHCILLPSWVLEGLSRGFLGLEVGL